MPARVPLSVLVATRNEEKNLPACLEGAAFADEIVVVDSNSVDATAAIAEQHGAGVVQFPGIEATGMRKRTWAIDNLHFRHEWLLVLDADERITPELAEEIRQTLAAPRFDAYRLLFLVEFDGVWIRHCGWYPAYMLRLFRLGVANYEHPALAWSPSMGDVEVHERIVTDRPTGHLENELLHHDYRGIGNWIEKHNRYSDWEAARRLAGLDEAPFLSSVRLLLGRDQVDKRRAVRQLAMHAPARPVVTFLFMYLWKRGFLDGWAGLRFCVLHAVHQLHVNMKVRQLQAEGVRVRDGSGA